MSNVNMLLVGGFMLAIAIEQSNLHRRIALGALKLVGSNPRSLMFGFMFVSWFLSMCIANTSTTALMIPIVLSERIENFNFIFIDCRSIFFIIISA